MPTNTLTDHQCRSAKPAEKPRKLFDGHGLHLYISTTGAKIWRMAYRLDGKPQTATLGPYPLLSLADARMRRDEVRRKLLDGVSPKKASQPKARMTLKAASDLYWAGRKDVSDSYRTNALRGIAMHLEPALGQRDIGSITRADLLAELQRMDAAGLSVYVRKVRMWISQVFDWAVENGHAESNPAAAIRAKTAFSRAKVVSYAALELTEVARFFERLSLENPDMQSVLGCKLLALTWVRTGELRMMEWDEIDGDMWRIPEGKMKRSRDLMVPLSRQAMEIIEQMRLRRRGSIYVFPAEHRIDRPMSENTVLYLMYRMGYKGIMTGHGWRTVASTWANEHGYDEDAIERQLAHVPDNKVRAVYNRAAYLAERRTMIQAWADWLDNPDTSSLQS